MISSLVLGAVGATLLSPAFPAAVGLPFPAALGLTANVTDPLSHGVLGDARLSLDEAIRLCNGTLAMWQLSPAEAANVTGAGSVVDHVLIDPMVTLSIQLEGPLTPITGQGLGPVHIEGIVIPAPGHGITTILLGGSHAHIFALHTNAVTVSGLHLSGGQVGFDVRTSQGGYAEALMGRIDECDMHTQTVASVRLTGIGLDHSTVMLHHCVFHNSARAILVQDQSSGGFVVMHAMHCHFDGVALACETTESGAGGAMSMVMFDRSEFDLGANFVRVLRLVHCDVTTTGDAVDVQGSANGLTMIHHHHSSLAAGPGQMALVVGPKTAEFDIHGSEMEFTGNVLLRGNLFTQRVWQQNSTYLGGLLTFDVDGSLPNLLWNRYQNCQIVVPSTGRTAVRVRSCELVSSTVTGQSLLAPVTLEGCWRSATTMAGQVTETGAVAGRFLSACSVTPAEVSLGAAFDLDTDAPAGVGVFWLLSLAIDQPNTTQEPFRFYGDPLTAQTLFLTFGQSTVSLTVPNDPAFLDYEFYLAPVAFSTLAYGPELTLPRGGRMQPVE